MSTKTKTKTNYNETQKAAPPDWTLPGITDVAGRVTDALDTLPGDPYTGNFAPIPDAGMTNSIIQAYQDAAGASQTASNTLGGQYAKLFGGYNNPSFDSNSLFSGFDLAAPPPTYLGTPGLPGAQPVATANILDRPDAMALFNQFGYNQKEFTPAQILARPDIAAMAPELRPDPTYLDYNPTHWDPGDGEARLNAALQAAIQPVMRQLTEQVLPGIKSTALDAGAYTGDRAMMVLPTQAIAEAGGRAGEITQQLAYQGYQADEDRSLQSWQELEQLRAAEAARKNAFNTAVWESGNQQDLTKFDITAGVESQLYQAMQNALIQNAQMQNTYNTSGNNVQADLFRSILDATMGGYGTQQEALLRNAGMLNDTNVANRGIDASFLKDIFGINTDAALRGYDIFTGRQVDQGNLTNDAYRAATDRGLGVSDSRRSDLSLADQMLMDSLLTKTAVGDLQSSALAADLARQQGVISDALGRDQYNLEYPFRGLDIATALLTQLSGNYGTIDKSGQQTSVQSTGGLGSVIQGIAGIASMAASLGAFGPLGSAAGAAGKAAPVASSIFGGGARAGMAA